MTTWLLIFYLTVGAGASTTGGPATIDGFTTKDKCEAHTKKIREQFQGYVEFAICQQVDK